MRKMHQNVSLYIRFKSDSIPDLVHDVQDVFQKHCPSRQQCHAIFNAKVIDKYR